MESPIAHGRTCTLLTATSLLGPHPSPPPLRRGGSGEQPVIPSEARNLSACITEVPRFARDNARKIATQKKARRGPKSPRRAGRGRKPVLLACLVGWLCCFRFAGLLVRGRTFLIAPVQRRETRVRTAH